MELSTLNTIENILRADRTVTPGQRRAILSVCTGEAPSPRRAERMLTATEISERLHIMANKPIGLKSSALCGRNAPFALPDLKQAAFALDHLVHMGDIMLDVRHVRRAPDVPLVLVHPLADAARTQGQDVGRFLHDVHIVLAGVAG